jgi:hypothetical protein
MEPKSKKNREKAKRLESAPHMPCANCNLVADTTWVVSGFRTLVLDYILS